MNKSYVRLWILCALTLVNDKANARACDGYFPCQTDDDCWNGPGFRCVNTVSTIGGPFTGTKICVCGGHSPITSPDGIERNFSCTFDGFYNNGIRLCLIQPGSPCWPTEDLINEFVIDLGASLDLSESTRSSLSSLRNYYCAAGICSEEEDLDRLDGLLRCKELGNYYH